MTNTPATHAALTIPEFCVRNRMSRAKFYEEVNAGRGPKIMYVGPQKRLIAPEAESDWRRDCEARSAKAEAAA